MTRPPCPNCLAITVWNGFGINPGNVHVDYWRCTLCRTVVETVRPSCVDEPSSDQPT